MPSAIFLRAVNVGGTSVTSVAAIAKKLGLQNIGAAGTFVAQKGTAGSLRKSILAELGFETDVMVVPQKDISALVEAAPLARHEGKPFVVVLAKAPSSVPKLPVEAKGVRLVGVEGVFALALVLPDAKPGANVTALVEKTLGVAGTARGWPTMERVAKALAATT